MSAMKKALSRRRAVEAVARARWADDEQRDRKTSWTGRTRGEWDDTTEERREAYVYMADRTVCLVEVALAAEGLYDLPPRVGGRA